MDIFSTKLFELVSLRHSISYELVLRGLFNDEQASFALEIDEFTYRQLESSISFEENSKYRLSLNVKWDPYKKQYYSSIAKIDGNSVESYYYECSDDFQAQLNQLKKCQHIEDLSHIEGLQMIPPKIKIFSDPLKKTESQPTPADLDQQPSVIHQIIFRTVTIFIMMIVLFIALQIIENTILSSGEAASEAESIATPPPAEADQTIDIQSEVEDPLVNPYDPYQQPFHGQSPGSPSHTTHNQAYENAALLELNELIYSVPKGYVALTFDDGPSKYTEKIVDILVEHHVGATFFFIGRNAVQFPEAVQYAHANHMLIGSHSMNHGNLSRASADIQQEDLQRATDVLESLTGVPVTFFRPPYGLLNKTLIENVKEQQMKIILWNRDPQDWKSKQIEDVLQYFNNTSASGGIYLLHENEITVQALPAIIAHLKSGNIEFTSFK